MRRLLFCCAVVSALTAPTHAQAPAGQTRQTPAPAPTPAQPATPATQAPRPATQTPPPATPTPPVRRPAPAAAPTGRGGVTIVVTDMSGMPLGDIRVLAQGPTERSGTTDPAGTLRITGMQAGTYRLRFTSANTVDFEREVVVRGGPNVEVDVSLRPAPPPVVIKETAPAPEPPPQPSQIGPVGKPQSLNIQGMPNSEFIRNEPRRETLLSCSGNARSTLVQMNQDQAVRLYESADASYYVVAGEGTLRLVEANRDVPLEATSYVSVPRGTRFSIVRKGRRPLIMVMVLSGEPCEEAK